MPTNIEATLTHQNLKHRMAWTSSIEIARGPATLCMDNSAFERSDGAATRNRNALLVSKEIKVYELSPAQGLWKKHSFV